MKINKIVVWLCVLLMLFNSVVCVTAQETSEQELDKSSQVLVSLGIIEEVQNLQKEVTRGEFAQLMAHMFNINYDADHAITSFIDVSEKHEYYGEICWLLDKNAIAKGNMFEPDRGILMKEAAKIMVSLLGYEYMAQSKGGYPFGYVALARDNGILDNVTYLDDKVLTYSDAYNMMVSMLESEPVDIFSENSNRDRYEKTFMYYTYGMRKVKGIVTSDGITSIKNCGVCRDGSISIDDVIFEKSDKLVWGDWLGYRVEAYVYSDDLGDTVCYVEPFRNGEQEISAKIIDRIVNNTVEYYVDKKTKKIKLNDSIEYIYNNKSAGFDSLDDIIQTQGYVKFIDNDNDNKYDIVKVYKYSDMVLSHIDVENKKLFDTKRGKVIELYDSNISYNIYKDGKEIEFEELAQNDILTYYQSLDEESIQIYVSNAVIEGNVSAKNIEEGRTYLTINDVEYTISEDCNYIPEHGYKGEFLLNIYNDIVQVDYMFGEGKTFGYVLRAFYDDFEEKLSIKMYTGNGFIETIEFAKNVTVDGVRTKDMQQVYSALCRDSSGAHIGEVVKQPIRYEVNNKYQVKLIDTLRNDTFGKDDYFNKDFESTSIVYKQTGVFESKVGINSDTTIMLLPNEIDSGEDFEKLNIGAFSVDRTYSIEAYSLSETKIAEFMLVKENENVVKPSIMFVSKEYTTILDDEIVTCFEGYIDGSFVEVCVYPEYVNDEIDRGDVIKCYGSTHLNKSPVLLYDHSEDEIKGTEPFRGSRYHVTKGRVTSIDDTYILMEVGEEYYLHNLATIGDRLYLFESDGRGSINKVDYTRVQVGDEIVVHSSSSMIKSAMIIE